MKTILKIIGAVIIIMAIGGIINSTKNKTSSPTPSNDTQSQTQSSSQATSEPTKKDLVLRDVKYGTDKRNTMNVLIPKGSNNKTPFILFMHGGAWISGDKNDVAIIQIALGGAGIASASINYRYASNTVHYTDLMNDVDKAVNYIVEHGDEWNVDTNKIAIGGISAGAHMAMLYAYNYDKGNHIDAVISMAGPTNLADTVILDASINNKLISGVENMVGARYTPGKPLDAKFTDSSPIDHIKNIPTLIIHGTGDTVVDYSQAQLLADAFKQKKYTYDLMAISGANHDLGLGNPTTAKQIADKVVAWVKKYDK